MGSGDVLKLTWQCNSTARHGGPGIARRDTEMKLTSIGGSVLPLLLGALLSACQSTDSPQMAALRQQAEQTAIAAQKNRVDQNDYISALQTYKAHRSKTLTGAEESLYKEYKTLLAKYTATITFFWPVNPGDKDPHLPVVAFPTGPVTVEIIKADYITMAQDYRDVLKGYTARVNNSLPPEPPPLPPVRSSDKDAHKLVNLEKTLSPALDAALASRGVPQQKIGGGWADVPLGGLHNHPGPPPLGNGGWCQFSSDGALMPC